ncbi:Got1/Sft2-like family-domain-containing protein [Ustulina deusta]|nr:Got1/Sft2-like family-domain-containing protein [Ustulina deusta]
MATPPNATSRRHPPSPLQLYYFHFPLPHKKGVIRHLHHLPNSVRIQAVGPFEFTYHTETTIITVLRAACHPLADTNIHPFLTSPIAFLVDMASASFRESMNSLGWSRRDPDQPVSTTHQTGLLSSIKSLSPFGDRGYVQLPTTEGAGAPLPASNRRDEEEGWFVLSRWDRLLIFGACNLGALACFVLSFALWPILMTKPRKFVILWSFGSLLFTSSFGAVMGPRTYLQHLTSGPRLPFTAAYFGSIALTIYFSVGLQNTILTLISALVQIACLLWYLVSYFPMGSSGLRLATTFGARRAAAWMTG